MSDTPNPPTVAFSLTVKSTSDALAFYSAAFNAVELFRMPAPGGGTFHAEFMLGNTRIYISDEAESFHAKACPEGAMAPCLFAISIDDPDAAFKQAVEAGGTPLNEPETHFWGSRTGMILDPFGYRWSLTKQVEEVAPEEIMRRAGELFG